MKVKVTNPFSIAYSFPAGDSEARVPAAGYAEFGDLKPETVQSMRDAGMTVDVVAATAAPAADTKKTKATAPAT